ncbi:hypothetical protein AXK56_16385 [Tsukamurella pulmonis]|uniref:TrbL/VirB6 plasmid conjugal transfer protein n=1 Tax=Tsukamurella pulmonis TaxID=47312 RepID=A0A1H1A7I4_9ACTN|nr:hypothetical protein [Tsukamurella pulmonis]KXO95789.1 hypothetical protein AXK56_16385 [Tsukamurella pulmonis]SDQ35623.1 hypothetical protein SAMN04489765_0090 [Tsukamurella pulmonis]SUQ39448.1 Uncharacterised protein [Tsukamurella pulmonis]
MGGTLDKFVNSLYQGYETILVWALGFWVKLPTPTLDSSNSSLMADIQEYTVWIQIVGVCASLMFFASRMVWSRQQGLVDEAEDGFKVIIRATLATSFIPIALTAGGRASDAFSSWLVTESIGRDPGDGSIIKNFLHLNKLTGGQLGTGVLMLVGIVGVLGAFLQLIFLIVRQAMLLMVVATLPIAASFSGTGPGSQAYSKLIGWSVAFLMFKPVGALCYFIAFRAAGAKDPSEQQVLLAMVMMGMCAFVLPSLMRLLGGGVTGSMGSGASGAAAVGAAVGAGVAIAGLAATGGGSAAAGASTMSSRAGAAGAASGGGGVPGLGSGGAGGAGEGQGGQASMSPSSEADGAPAQSPGAQSASGGGGDKDKSISPAMSMAAAGAVAGGAAGGVGSETDAGSDVQFQPPPPMRSGWGDNAASS